MMCIHICYWLNEQKPSIGRNAWAKTRCGLKKKYHNALWHKDFTKWAISPIEPNIYDACTYTKAGYT